MNTEQAFKGENDLLRALRQDDPKAFQAVYKQSFPLVTRSIINMSGQQDEAEEMYHSALLVLYNKASDATFKLECKISTYLVAVARKKWLKELEKKKRLTEKERNYALTHTDEKAEASVDWDKIAENDKKHKILANALEKLGSPCKELIISFYIKEMNMKDIADQFDYTNANNAKTQKHKCLQRLKKLFFEDE